MFCHKNPNFIAFCIAILALLCGIQIDVVLAVDQARPAKKDDSFLLPIKIHGCLMYASIGFLMPIGILLARQMGRARRNAKASTKSLQILYYLHLVLQTACVAVMTGGAVFSFKKFDYNFQHTHERIGISLWILIWVQPIIGFLRPNHGVRARPIWYSIHWLLGSVAAILGILNLYIGMKIWELITKESLRTFNIAFSVQVSIMALIYFLQDRWDYIIEQRCGLTKPISPAAPPQSTLIYSQVPMTAMELYQMRHYLPS